MTISVFDLFKIGIGPSSSHTVGPMRAAQIFVQRLKNDGLLEQVTRVKSELYGSLGATGKGHGSGPAVLLGLEGHTPEQVDPILVKPRAEQITIQHSISLLNEHQIGFDGSTDLIFHRLESLPYHPNGMIFTAYDASGAELSRKTYYSVGGGFVTGEETISEGRVKGEQKPLPYTYKSAEELLVLCRESGLSISEITMENEKTLRSEEQVRAGILELWQVMKDCVKQAIKHEGVLPGRLKVKRRAAALYKDLKNCRRMDMITPSLGAMDWVNLYALAVSEENAAGGRIVTAPTNGAAGIVPAVLHYYDNFCPNSDEEGIIRFFLAASAVGFLFKVNASISGAEVGCQGEVGSACAMAAAGIAEATGAAPEQVENAAEIAMEHNLGLTCDPVGGLVQVPCIERNAIGAMKAINAASMAVRGDGNHFVSLDKVIKTMRDTGADMMDKYKETSRGGLAVNVIEC